MHDDHDANLEDWRQNAQKNDDKNFQFLRSLKMVSSPARIDALTRELHDDAFARIDCTRCANCCKTMPPALSDADVDRIAGHLGMTREAFIETYLLPNREEGGYDMKELPCPFLGEDDRCTIYDARPDVCRRFPHTDSEHFASRSYQHSANAKACPAVFYVVERMRERRRG